MQIFPTKISLSVIFGYDQCTQLCTIVSFKIYVCTLTECEVLWRLQNGKFLKLYGPNNTIIKVMIGNRCQTVGHSVLESESSFFTFTNSNIRDHTSTNAYNSHSNISRLRSSRFTHSSPHLINTHNSSITMTRRHSNLHYLYTCKKNNTIHTILYDT